MDEADEVREEGIAQSKKTMDEDRQAPR